MRTPLGERKRETMTIHKQLKRWGACPEGLDWAKQFDSWQALWEAIPRADWAFWLLGKVGLPARELSLVCYETVRPEIWDKLTDERSRRALDLIPRYWDGELSFEEFREAALAADEAERLAWEQASAAWAEQAAGEAWARAAQAANAASAAKAAVWVAQETKMAAWAAVAAVKAAMWAAEVAANAAVEEEAWAAPVAEEEACHLRMCDRLRGLVDISALELAEVADTPEKCGCVEDPWEYDASLCARRGGWQRGDCVIEVSDEITCTRCGYALKDGHAEPPAPPADDSDTGGHDDRRNV